MLKHATISRLTPKTLKAMAHDFEAEARMLRLEAAEGIARLSMRRASDRHIAHLRSSAGMVQATLDRGYDLDATLRMVAPSFGCQVATIESHWRRYLTDLKTLDKLRRAIKIIKGARAGKSNAAIAQTLDPPLHANSVSRILRKHIDAQSGLREQRRVIERQAQALSDSMRAIDDMRRQAQADAKAALKTAAE